LDEFEIRFHSLVENSHAGISLLGAEGKVIYVSPSAQGMMGYKNEELIGKDPVTFIHPNDKDRVRRIIRELTLKAGKTRSLTYRSQHKNGSWRWVSANLTNMLHCPEVRAIVINFEDATTRILAEEELLKTAANLRSIFQNTDTGLMLIDTDFTIIAFNHKINEWIVKENQKRLEPGVSCLDYVGADKKDRIRKVLKEVLAGRKLRYQFRGEKVNGDGNWYEVRLQRITKENSIPIGINISTTDISKIKHTEEIIQRSEKLYRSLFNKSPLPKWVCDRHTLRYLEVNDKAVEHYGYTREEFLTMSAFELRPPEDHDELTELLGQKPAGEFRSSSVRHIKRNGEIVFAEVVAHPITYKNKEAYLVIAHDISRTLQLQHDLMEEKVNKQIEVTRATLDAQEKERSELGRELHDNVNQMLGTAKLYLSYGLGHKKVQSEFVKKSMEIIHSAIDELRHLSKSLIPPSLVMGLRTAIDELINGISLLTGMTVKTEIPFVNEQSISQGLKISIFRIIQEGLNNIIKYAAATEIKVAIDQQTDYLDLRIEDNGNGFDVNAKRNGIGLSNIINRAEAYNGTVNINSEPGKGCALHIRFKFA
jgi:PAS domain S-box-containing protein